jgi:CheY-like chemotaxis protein
VSKEIVERHNGNIGMVAVEGKGTIVYIEIPVEAYTDSNATSFDTDEPVEASSIQPSRVQTTSVFRETTAVQYEFELSDVKLNRAMIATHHPALASMIAQTLGAYVADVVTVTTDAQAVATMREGVDNFERFNIVYIDRDLPGRHSYVILSRLRKFGYTGVAVLLSGQDFMDTNSRFLSCGGDAVLFQPVTEQDIEMTLMGMCCDLCYFIVIHSIYMF